MPPKIYESLDHHSRNPERISQWDVALLLTLAGAYDVG